MAGDYFRWAGQLFDPARVATKPEALRGVRVLDLSVIIFGPATADFLGELGAEVIRVELPGSGDVTRILGHAGCFWQNVSVAFFPQNHSKYHVGIDLHHPEGQALVRRLACRADILVENFKPGTTETKWGLGYRQLRALNPRLIYVANTGFGQWGPLAEGRASYDGLAQAVSGLAAISGFEGGPPVKAGNYLGDWFGACLAALGALAALHWRDRTGEGQFVEMAQCEGLVRALDWTWLYAGLVGRDRPRAGNRDPVFVPSGVFACRDGAVAVVAGSDAEFRGLCAALGRPDLADDPRFATREARRQPAHADRLDTVLAEWCRGRTRAEVEAAARSHGFAAARVMDAADHYQDPHFRARRSVWELEDPLYGRMVDYGPAPKLSATPARHKWAGKPVGWHNDYVLKGLLGLSDAEVADLERRGVVGRWADRPGAKPPDHWTAGAPAL
ncbi:MAG: CoA transferase [Armatimonadota bacterium]|nr:CoA transferase [Armatimonadota bacterium]MDR7492270.1 CoA transferase [Armatimonadota bacterium]MDR7593210.1 CoA transferase [Armatimonadota bacterium]